MSHIDASSQHVVDRQATVLRLAKKRGFSFAVISAETDISVSTLTSYEKGTAMPLHNAVKLMRALPADLGSLLIEETGYRLCPIETGGETWDSVAADVSGLTFQICEARKDGRFTPQEIAKLEEAARIAIAKLQGMLA